MRGMNDAFKNYDEFLDERFSSYKEIFTEKQRYCFNLDREEKYARN